MRCTTTVDLLHVYSMATLPQLAARTPYLKEKQLHERLKDKEKRLEDKENLIALVKEQLHETEMKAAHSLARSTAVLCDRVVLDTGLRRKYDPKMTFSGRYHLFLEEEVLCGDKPALSETARGVLHQVPKEVKEGEVVKELQGLAHSVPKPLHCLSPSIGEGLYVGGDAVLMVAVTILVALLQRQHHIPGAVKVVDHTGKPVYSVVGGAVKDIRPVQGTHAVR